MTIRGILDTAYTMKRSTAMKASLLLLLPLLLTSWSLSMLFYRYLASDDSQLPAPTINTRHISTRTPSRAPNMLAPTTINTHTVITSTHTHITNSQTVTSNTGTYVYTTNTQASDTNTHFTNTHIDYTATNTNYRNTHTNSTYRRTNTTYTTTNPTNDHTKNTNTHTITTYTYHAATNTATNNTNPHTHAVTSASHRVPSSASAGHQVGCEEEYQGEGARRVVVLWTPFWHTWSAWREMLDYHGRLREGRCPKWRCDFLLGSEASEAQVADAAAIVFFGLDALSRPLPPRYPHALWIWLELEAPPISQMATGPWSQLEALGVFFNLTMSYHHLNPVVASLGQLVPLSTPQHCPLPSTSHLSNSSSTYISFNRHMHDFDARVRQHGERADTWLRAYRRRLHGGLLHRPQDEATAADSLLQNRYDQMTNSRKRLSLEAGGLTLTDEEVRWATRPRLAAWMASHCRTESRREELVAALRRFIAITTVGKCGELRCGKNHKDAYCYRWLAASHLFYLSFENALCEDYHTEKLWRPLEHAMVPVVYGAPTHRHILPFDSYIDVTTFPSAAALAAHLLHLATHPSAYLRHLQWRRYWRVRWPVPWCDLCAALHCQAGQAHASLDLWWNSTTTCNSPLSL